MNAEEYIVCYEKYISGKCSPEEIQRMYEFRDGFELLKAEQDNPEHQQLGLRILDRVQQSTQAPVKRLFPYTLLYKAAAILFMLGSVAVLLYDNHQPGAAKLAQGALSTTPHPTIVPGKPSATLTLSDGAVVNLNELDNGVIAASGAVGITKADQQSISYAAAQKANIPANAKNTISVPRGGSYTITLPDGTKVWLNAASSLTYPVNFSGKTRSVSLQGEAYFEVAKNKEKPFLVQSRNTVVEVLGTHFNLKAYPDDRAVAATLLEGSVRFSNSAKEVILKPGEQGQSGIADAGMTTRKVNVSQEICWKNGYFMFQDNSITEIMDQIGRWYDVEVEIKSNPDQKTFGGIYSRNKDINELLKGLELTGLVHFKIEGRKITVTQ